MSRRRRHEGEYYPLAWDGDGTPAAHYVTGHVTDEQFRAEIDRWFAGRLIVPVDAVIEHVYVRSVRVENDDYGNRAHEWRQTSKDRGFPMTYWEIVPNRSNGG